MCLQDAFEDVDYDLLSSNIFPSSSSDSGSSSDSSDSGGGNYYDYYSSDPYGYYASSDSSFSYDSSSSSSISSTSSGGESSQSSDPFPSSDSSGFVSSGSSDSGAPAVDCPFCDPDPTRIIVTYTNCVCNSVDISGTYILNVGSSYVDHGHCEYSTNLGDKPGEPYSYLLGGGPAYITPVFRLYGSTSVLLTNPPGYEARFSGSFSPGELYGVDNGPGECTAGTITSGNFTYNQNVNGIDGASWSITAQLRF